MRPCGRERDAGAGRRARHRQDRAARFRGRAAPPRCASCARAESSRRRRSRSLRCSSSSDRRSGCSSGSRRRRRSRSEVRLRYGRRSARALRHRCGDAQSARGVCRGRPGGGPDRRRPVARSGECRGAAVRGSPARRGSDRGLIAVREGEPSLIDGAGLGPCESWVSAPARRRMLPAIGPDTVRRLHEATAATRWRCSRAAATPPNSRWRRTARLCRLRQDRAGVPAAHGRLHERERRTLLLAATSESGDLAPLERAAARSVSARPPRARRRRTRLARRGRAQFLHPLARSALYAHASAEAAAAHTALATALPDRDVDRRAWHLAAAAAGPILSLRRARAGRRLRARTERVRQCRRRVRTGGRSTARARAAAR